MDLNDIANSLFGKRRAETTARANNGYTTTIYGTAVGGSSNGIVRVHISDNVTADESLVDTDDDPGTSVVIPTSPYVEKGDAVLVTLIGSEAAKHPFVSGVVGSGDRTMDKAVEAKEAADAENERALAAEDAIRTSFENELSQAQTDANTAIAAVQKDIDDFKTSAESTYATKTEVDEKTGAITTTLTTDYLSKSDASTTYATKTELKESSDGLSATITSNYNSFTAYQTTNDEAVAQAKAAGVNAQTDLDSYKKSNDSAVSSVTSDLTAYKATTDATLETLQNIADAAIETWYLEGEPTTENQPASSWTTDDLKKQHSGDLYYDTATGYAYRWDGSKWNRIKDSDIASALGEIEDIKTTYATKSELSATDTELKAAVSESLEEAKTYSSGLVTKETADREAAITEATNQIQASVASEYVTNAEFYNTDDAKNMDWEWDPFDFDDGNTETEGLKQYAENTQTDLDGFKTEVKTTYATKAELTVANDSITAEVTARKTTDETVTNLVNDLSQNYVTIDSTKQTDDSQNPDWEWDPFDFDDGNTETAGIIQKADNANDAVSDLSDDLSTNYSTTTEMKSVISTSATSILSTVSSTYKTIYDTNGLRNLWPNPEFDAEKNIYYYPGELKKDHNANKIESSAINRTYSQIKSSKPDTLILPNSNSFPGFVYVPSHQYILTLTVSSEYASRCVLFAYVGFFDDDLGSDYNNVLNVNSEVSFAIEAGANNQTVSKIIPATSDLSYHIKSVIVFAVCNEDKTAISEDIGLVLNRMVLEDYAYEYSLSSRIKQNASSISAIFTTGTGSELVDTTNQLSTLIRLDSTGVAVGLSEDGGKTYSNGYTHIGTDSFDIYTSDGTLATSLGQHDLYLGMPDGSGSVAETTIHFLNNVGIISISTSNNTTYSYDSGGNSTAVTTSIPDAFNLYSGITRKSNATNVNDRFSKDVTNGIYESSCVVGASGFLNSANIKNDNINAAPPNVSTPQFLTGFAYISFNTMIGAGTSDSETEYQYTGDVSIAATNYVHIYGGERINIGYDKQIYSNVSSIPNVHVTGDSIYIKANDTVKITSKSQLIFAVPGSGTIVFFGRGNNTPYWIDTSGTINSGILITDEYADNTYLTITNFNNKYPVGAVIFLKDGTTPSSLGYTGTWTQANFAITNSSSKKVLDVAAGAVTTNQANVDIYDYNGTVAQLWHLYMNKTTVRSWIRTA